MSRKDVGRVENWKRWTAQVRQQGEWLKNLHGQASKAHKHGILRRDEYIDISNRIISEIVRSR